MAGQLAERDPHLFMVKIRKVSFGYLQAGIIQEKETPLNPHSVRSTRASLASRLRSREKRYQGIDACSPGFARGCGDFLFLVE